MTVSWTAEIECVTVSWVAVETDGDAPTDEQVMEAASMVVNHRGSAVGEDVIVEILREEDE
jgi:hypothetical protein